MTAASAFWPFLGGRVQMVPGVAMLGGGGYNVGKAGQTRGLAPFGRIVGQTQCWEAGCRLCLGLQCWVMADTMLGRQGTHGAWHPLVALLGGHNVGRRDGEGVRSG